MKTFQEALTEAKTAKEYLSPFGADYVAKLKSLVGASIINYALARNLEIILPDVNKNIIAITKFDDDEYELFDFQYNKEGSKFIFHKYHAYTNSKDAMVRRDIKEEIPYQINSDKELKEVIDFIAKELKKLGFK